jgi:hypothetical protein
MYQPGFAVYITLGVMEPTGVKFPFEFCALRYLLQWQRKEASFHAQMRSPNPELPNLRKALRYFQVARNFKGLKHDARAEVVRDKLLETRARTDLSTEQQVENLACSFGEAGFQHNISAASKLLWLSCRKSIIYDSRAFIALKEEYGHRGERSDYQAYCASWKRAYKEAELAVLNAVNELPKVRAFLPGDTPDDDRLLAMVRKPWFRERVFDLYLWELGGDG